MVTDTALAVGILHSTVNNMRKAGAIILNVIYHCLCFLPNFFTGLDACLRSRRADDAIVDATAAAHELHVDLDDDDDDDDDRLMLTDEDG